MRYPGKRPSRSVPGELAEQSLSSVSTMMWQVFAGSSRKDPRVLWRVRASACPSELPRERVPEKAYIIWYDALQAAQ